MSLFEIEVLWPKGTYMLPGYLGHHVEKLRFSSFEKAVEMLKSQGLVYVYYDEYLDCESQVTLPQVYETRGQFFVHNEDGGVVVRVVASIEWETVLVD